MSGTVQGTVNSGSPFVAPPGRGCAGREPSVAPGGTVDLASSEKLFQHSKHLLKLGMGKRALALDAYRVASENVVIVGKRNTGKSYLGSVIVEELLSFNRKEKLTSAGLSVVIFAPSGGWWGLKAGRGGSARGGNRVLAIGGEHADFPLDPRMGARIADLVDAMRPVAVLVEMAALTVAEQQELIADFAERLAMSQARRLLHLVFDEAEDFFPTSPVRGPQLRAALALDSLVRRRRARGIAVTMVTSRLANLHRNVTSQSSRFFVFGMSSPQDLDAADELVRYGGLDRKTLLSAQVARLSLGEAIHITFGEEHGQSRFFVRRLRTFDSHQYVPIGATETSVKLASVAAKTRKRARAILFPPTNTHHGDRRGHQWTACD
jgi:hypothetical protein